MSAPTETVGTSICNQLERSGNLHLDTRIGDASHRRCHADRDKWAANTAVRIGDQNPNRLTFSFTFEEVSLLRDAMGDTSRLLYKIFFDSE